MYLSTQKLKSKVNSKLLRSYITCKQEYNDVTTRAAPAGTNLALGSGRVAVECSVSVGARATSSCVAECECLVGSRGGEGCSPAPLSPAEPARAPGLPVAKLASPEALAGACSHLSVVLISYELKFFIQHYGRSSSVLQVAFPFYICVRYPEIKFWFQFVPACLHSFFSPFASRFITSLIYQLPCVQFKVWHSACSFL